MRCSEMNNAVTKKEARILELEQEIAIEKLKVCQVMYAIQEDIDTYGISLIDKTFDAISEIIAVLEHRKAREL